MNDIRMSFASATDDYGSCNPFHAALARRLASLLRKAGREFDSAIEIGSHTGVQTREILPLLERDAELVLSDIHTAGRLGLAGLCGRRFSFLVADGERMPFPDGSFELVFSGAAFQWFREPGAALRDLLRLLKPGGFLAFSIFLAPSLEPLRSAFAGCGEGGRFLPLLSEDGLDFLLLGLPVADLEVVEETKYHPDLRSMVKSIKAAGAGASAFRDAAIPRQALLRIKAETERGRTERGLPLTLKAAVVTVLKEQRRR